MKCIILVGVSGERLWPISRDLYPKSMLKLYGSKNFLQNSFELAKSIVAPRNIIAISNVENAETTRIKLKELYSKPIVISEPIEKNTAASVASALTYIESDKDETVIILPCDFVVKNNEEFLTAINKAKTLASKGYIVSLGVKPNQAETGYKYIKTEKPFSKGYSVSEIIENPTEDLVNKYIKSDNYYWNTGVYIAKRSVLINAIEKCSFDIFINFDSDMFDENMKIKYSAYENIPSLSIDTVISKEINTLALVELETQWLDFGSWETVYDNSKKDKNKNVIQGNVLVDKVENSFVYSTKELVAVSGIQDTIVIETEDAVLVADKNKAQEVNEIVKKLREENHEETKLHKTVYRPWGYYTCLTSGNGWLSKIITVLPGHALSLQSHEHRSEHWVVLEGNATIVLEEETHNLQKRQSINIPIGAKHSLQNNSNEPLKILEVQKGDYISEDDIIRYEDMYGRVK